MPDLKEIYHRQFLPTRDEAWFETYCRAVEEAAAADETKFKSPTFQKGLWEVVGVASIGPGSAVTVPGAYEDPEIVNALWSLRNWDSPTDPRAQAAHLDAEFERILAMVTPRHNTKRPAARLVRIFAVLRPYDVNCLMDSKRTWQFLQWAGRKKMGLGRMGQNVIGRQATRDALGPENNIADAVSYSQFSWFVWTLISAAENEVPAPTPNGAEGGLGVETGPENATDAPKLVLLPPAMQRKGMFYVTGNLQLLMLLVRAAENGTDKDDLLQQIAEEAPNLNLGSRQNVLSQAGSLNLLFSESGTYRPTPNGRALLEGESPSDVLTPIFVRTVFGFALILRDLSQTKMMTRGAIVERAQGYYPKWTTPFAPNALVAWAQDLGLAEVKGNGRSAEVQLTEIGEYWASGLPPVLPELPAEKQAEFDDVVVAIASDKSQRFEAAAIGPVFERFTVNPELNKFVFSETQVRLIHAALHSTTTKRFILLAGLSGTGKTTLARAYARAYCEVQGLPAHDHYQQIAVWPDWTDPSGLLGFVNPLADPPRFNETPALQLLLKAHNNPTKPYFLCLDEMNLARVEHYFSPFLSAMEGRGSSLSIHAGNAAVDNIPNAIPWPDNLFIIGTVNMDETTFPFSDKVLDRAFTFEFWDVDLDAWREKAVNRGPTEVVDHVTKVLKGLYGALSPARRHFGYRTCDEVLGFCFTKAGLPLEVAIDAAVLSKVLPKLRGDSSGPLPNALKDAAIVCETEKLPQSRKKLVQMQDQLAALGAVRFWS